MRAAVLSLVHWEAPATSAAAFAAGNAAFAAAVFGRVGATAAAAAACFWLVLLTVPFALVYRALAPAAEAAPGSVPRSLAAVAEAVAEARPPRSSRDRAEIEPRWRRVGTGCRRDASMTRP